MREKNRDKGRLGHIIESEVVKNYLPNLKNPGNYGNLMKIPVQTKAPTNKINLP